MHRFLVLVSLFAATAVLHAIGTGAKGLPVTDYTVLAKVTSYEHYRAWGTSEGRSADAPYGNGSTLIATILVPESLAGREIAIPFESVRGDKELLVQKDTIFRFEHPRNLADLERQVDRVRRSPIAFPERGILVVLRDGKVAEAYPGSHMASK